MLNIFKPKTKVILDTNFLIMPGELGIDIFSEIQKLMQEPYELCVMKATLEELEVLMLKYGPKKEGFNVKLGFILAKQKNLKTLSSSSDTYADKAILEIAGKNPATTIVATQDKKLQGELKKLSARIITLRQKKYLALR